MKPKQMLISSILIATAAVCGARAAETTKPTVDLAIYGHVSSMVWVVKDLDPVLDYWQKLGLKDVQRTEVMPSKFVYRGKPVPATARSATTRVGGVLIEWIQPVTGNDVYTEFLKRHGDGIIALGFAVKSDQELERQVEYLRSKGVEVVQRNQWQGAKGVGHAVYFDTATQGGGFTLQVFHNPDAPVAGDAGREGNDAPFTKLTHYAFVVRDVRKVGAYWQGIGFGAMEVNHAAIGNRMYHGQPSKLAMDTGWWRFGDAPFEWVQSVQGPNVYEDYLKAHGEGFHHFGVSVPDMDTANKDFAAKGAPPTQWGGWDRPDSKGRFAYLDTDPHGGVTLELIWNQPMPH
jgi:catechol 2,3-dioxygenase-like lactoylglutathione lyase family enzyme